MEKKIFGARDHPEDPSQDGYRMGHRPSTNAPFDILLRKILRVIFVPIYITLISLACTVTPTAHNPDNPQQRLALGNQLLMQGNQFYSAHHFEQARCCFEQALQLFPHSAALNYNLGFTLAEMNRPHEAVAAYERALITSDTPATHVALATACLAAGEFTRGWREYEWRWQLPERQSTLTRPRYDGSDVRGKTVLVLSEGALGDVLQFVRFAQHLKSRGAHIILKTLAPLKALLSLCPYLDAVITDHDAIPTYDIWTSLMSLPYATRATLETLPTAPYIVPDASRATFWHAALAHDHTFKIGICWRADPANEANRPPHAQRSLDVELFAPLAHLPGVSLYSLQVDTHVSVPWLHTFDASFDIAHGSFMDTAAVMPQLDLVISVDTSVAHLAGALGINTWVILPYKSDWRWMLERTDSPWYPTMRLFRRGSHEEWSQVMQRVINHLSDMLGSS